METIIKILKYLFELRIEIINLLLLFMIGFCICSILTSKKLRVFIGFLWSVFLSLQLISLYFVNTFIGYQFYVHFNVRDITAMLGVYNLQIIVLSFIFFTIFFLFYDSKKLIRFFIRKTLRFKKIHAAVSFKFIFIFISVLSLYFMSSKGGIIHTSAELISMLTVKEQEIHTTLNKLGITAYTFPKDLEVKKGKNIIVLSLESLERGYLEGSLSHLTPNLNALKKKWNYYPMEQNSGSGWTSGSLYTYLTGFPAHFGIHGNDIFQKAYHSNITGISHIFQKAGYKMTYISSSDAEFSGTQELLHTFQIKRVIDQSFLGEKFRDKDLFEEAKKQIRHHTSINEPYVLFLATVDTHFPNGIYDERMEKYISPKATDLQFMVASLDYMIEDFINYLEQENLLSDTVIYIFPDHLKMGSPVIFDDHSKRGLYILTNADGKSLTKTDNLYQMDLPNIILDGANISHNASFLADYISGNKSLFIKDHIQELTALNIAGIKRFHASQFTPLKISKNYEYYKKDTTRYIAHAGGKIGNYTYTNALEALNSSYQNGLRLFELDIIKTKDQKFVAAHDWDHWAEITNYKGSLPVTESEFLKHPLRGKYTPMNMERINKWFLEHPDAILVTDKINTPKEFSEQFTDKKRLMMELFSWEAVKEGIAAGIKPVVSQSVLENLGSGAVEKLKKNNIRHIAVSRTFIAGNMDVLKRLKAHNIKVYAYHLNFSPGKDEKYVTKYEMDAIYGVYADTWSFNEP
ncbi:MAG: sulfatase-like hydrolase/transferase [Flavobacteriaceae bacterium]|nr:MAG: sulfatase-like hydrolase/transferase [Flavobacteriaceae bacterium]